MESLLRNSFMLSNRHHRIVVNRRRGFQPSLRLPSLRLPSLRLPSIRLPSLRLPGIRFWRGVAHHLKRRRQKQLFRQQTAAWPMVRRHQSTDRRNHIFDFGQTHRFRHRKSPRSSLPRAPPRSLTCHAITCDDHVNTRQPAMSIIPMVAADPPYCPIFSRMRSSFLPCALVTGAVLTASKYASGSKVAMPSCKCSTVNSPIADST